jgi:hypothetical protein
VSPSNELRDFLKKRRGSAARLTRGQVAVLNAIAGYLNGGTRQARPSITELSRVARYAPRQVVRILKTIEPLGIIATTRTAGRGNVYTLLHQGQEVTGDISSPVTSSTGTGDICDVSPVTFAPAHKEELVTENSTGLVTDARSARAAVVSGLALVVMNDNGNGARKKASKVEIIAPGDWPGDWADRCVEAWTPHGDITHGELGRWLVGLKRYPFPAVLRALVAWLDAGNSRFRPKGFAAEAGDWINGRNGRGQNRGQDAHDIGLAVAEAMGGER